RQRGHSCTLFERENCLGGRLRQESELEAPVLDAEIESIAALELDLRLNAAVTDAESFAEICQEFDAVLVACGAAGQALAPQWGLAASPRGIQVDAKTYATSREGVFAGGCAVRGKAMVVRSVADGKEAALAIGQYLAKQSVTGSRKPFSTRIGRMEAAEVQLMQLDAAQAARQEPDSPAAGYSDREAREQSRRCLHCDCRALTTCKLRIYADAYGADPRRYKSDRRPYTVDRQHAEVLFEPGKCIDCGLCIQIATAAGEAIGLTFVGRGFDVRVAAPLRKSIADALKNVAAACIEACPTAALAWKHDDRADE
ncbi:MAG: glutamate synthase, partial [Planctomycetota bacterium]